MAIRSTTFEQGVADFLRFTGNIPHRANDNIILILVLGMTGSGKSTLIQHCTQRTVQVGHGLQSCTNDLSVHSFRHDNHHIHMIDTPGFDDTNRSDIDTLKTISSYLSASFANGVRIGGIIYLHRISDNRIGSSSSRNLRMFKTLSGANAWPNTAIGTTMWKGDEYRHGEKREAELVGSVDYFGDLLSRGARLFRIAEHGSGEDEQRHSALRMVSHLIQQSRALPSIELQIQRELVIHKKSLDQTAAGIETLGDLYHLRCQLTLEMQNAHRDKQEALNKWDLDTARQLQALEDDFACKISKSEKDQEELKRSLMEMHDAEVEKLLTRVDDVEAHQHIVLATKRQGLQDMEAALELMREQSIHDVLRWEAQALEVSALEKKRRVDDQMDRECKQEIVALKQKVAQQETQLASVSQGKKVLRHNVVNGMSNGAMTAVGTVFGTALLTGAMCIVQ